MSDDHVHGPSCGQVEIISAEEPLLMVLVMHPDETGISKMIVRGTLPEANVPQLLRHLADDRERTYRARMS